MPGVVAELVDEPEPGRPAGVVDEDVDLAEALDRRVDDGLDLGWFITSPATKSTRSPAPISSSACLPLSALRPLSIDAAPSATNASAMPRPMPRVPPVMNATFPSRSTRAIPAAPQVGAGVVAGRR